MVVMKILIVMMSELKAKLSNNVYFATSSFKLSLSSGVNKHMSKIEPNIADTALSYQNEKKVD